MKNLLFALAISLLSADLQAQSIIPLPQHITYQPQTKAYQHLGIDAPHALTNEVRYLQKQLQALQYEGNKTQGNKVLLKLLPKPQAHPEAYTITFGHHITIAASTKAGIFYGIQSLIQLIGNSPKRFSTNIATISDEPKFKWRGMHLDVSRHFFSVSVIKQYLDAMALHKLNTFHWHLTDDQGWRIEIKKYPLLTTIGSYRSESMLEKNFNPYKGDGQAVSGFYTQEEIKEVVQYAAERHITVVPEIEMPGHSVAAISAYPWLGCTRKQEEVMKVWGVSENILCVKDSTFRFLFDVLDEVLSLFPSKYIHIGGDEVPKTNWKKCRNCQTVMRNQKLKDEHHLQSFFITRIDSFLTSKGRTTIGWDEILEGGLAPNAAVMSWRGEDGGRQAAALKHPVVMCPGSHCYFDHYQGNKKTEPLAFGGFTTVRKTYSYHPVPQGMSQEEAQYILGAQGNLWTEYIATPQHLFYMALPRMCALSEVVWTDKSLRNYDSFAHRLVQHFALLQRKGFNYAKAIFDVQAKSVHSHGALAVALGADIGGYAIHYTTDGGEPTFSSAKYHTPIPIKQSGTLRAALFLQEEKIGNTFQQDYLLHQGIKAQLTLSLAPTQQYSYGGSATLQDGIIGSLPWSSNEWLGWNGTDMNVALAMPTRQKMAQVRLSFLHEPASWIHLPNAISISVSEDGQTYRTIASLSAEVIREQWQRHKIITLPVNELTQYLKVQATCVQSIPEGNNGAGEKAWLFCSEVIVE